MIPHTAYIYMFLWVWAGQAMTTGRTGVAALVFDAAGRVSGAVISLGPALLCFSHLCIWLPESNTVVHIGLLSTLVCCLISHLKYHVFDLSLVRMLMALS